MWKIVLVILGILYILNPYDLLPDLMVGLGWLDDIAVLGLLIRFFYLQKKTRGAFRRYSQNNRDARNHFEGGAADESGPKGRAEQRDSETRWDPHRVLGLEPGASREDVKKAFRRLAGQYHPDKVGHLGEEFRILAEKRFKEIQRAYDELRH
jgi:DnaJ like chaperone protein